MAAHIIALIKINDPEKFSAYREKAMTALAKHGGTILLSSAELNQLEGNIELPDRATILIFPDPASALAWHSDPELIDTHALRTESGTSNIILL